MRSGGNATLSKAKKSVKISLINLYIFWGNHYGLDSAFHTFTKSEIIFRDFWFRKPATVKGEREKARKYAQRTRGASERERLLESRS